MENTLADIAKLQGQRFSLPVGVTGASADQLASVLDGCVRLTGADVLRFMEERHQLRKPDDLPKETDTLVIDLRGSMSQSQLALVYAELLDGYVPFSLALLAANDVLNLPWRAMPFLEVRA